MYWDLIYKGPAACRIRYWSRQCENSMQFSSFYIIWTPLHACGPNSRKGSGRVLRCCAVRLPVGEIWCLTGAETHQGRTDMNTIVVNGNNRYERVQITDERTPRLARNTQVEWNPCANSCIFHHYCESEERYGVDLEVNESRDHIR